MKAALKNADGMFRIAEVERPALPVSNWVIACDMEGTGTVFVAITIE